MMENHTNKDISSVDEAIPKEEGDWRVRLPVFEGPLDLLLYLIKKEEVDIYEVSLEHLTDQYLHYLQIMKMVYLDLAGEFLVMAATLLYIKSRTLLPRDQQPPEDEEDEQDPRWDLIRQLVEYKKFKDASWQLHLRQVEQEKHFSRGSSIDSPEFPPSPSVGEIGIFDLIAAFQKVLDRANEKEDLREIFEDRWTVSDKIKELKQRIQSQPSLLFHELFEGTTNRTEIVVTFLALLELIKIKVLKAIQEDAFSPITICQREGQDLSSSTS